jgi:gas vesicle protein
MEFAGSRMLEARNSLVLQFKLQPFVIFALYPFHRYVSFTADEIFEYAGGIPVLVSKEAFSMENSRKNGNNTTGAFILGSLIGGAAGFIYAMLSAPQSGAETQAQLRERAKALRAEANNRVETGRDSIKKSIDEQRLAVADWLEQGAAMLDLGAKEIQP